MLACLAPGGMECHSEPKGMARLALEGLPPPEAFRDSWACSKAASDTPGGSTELALGGALAGGASARPEALRPSRELGL